MFSIIPLHYTSIANNAEMPCFGRATADYIAGVEPNVLKAVALPNPRALESDKALLSDYYWTFFWAYPYAKVFWMIVVMGFLLSLVLHIARLPRIRRLCK